MPAAPGSVRGTYVEVIAGAQTQISLSNTQRAVAADGRDLEHVDRADPPALLFCPGSLHRLPTRTSDLIARRSSIAA